MYSTVLDVRTALTPGADATDATTAAHLSDEQISDAINEADGVIDSYVSNYYTIPTDVQVVIPNTDPVEFWLTAPFPVRWYSRDIAAWLITLTFKRNKDVTPDDPVRQRYNMAMGLLQRIASGEFTLPNPPFGPPPVEPGTEGGVSVFNLYEGKLFDMSDFQITQCGNDVIRRIYGRPY